MARLPLKSCSTNATPTSTLQKNPDPTKRSLRVTFGANSDQERPCVVHDTCDLTFCCCYLLLVLFVLIVFLCRFCAVHDAANARFANFYALYPTYDKLIFDYPLLVTVTGKDPSYLFTDAVAQFAEVRRGCSLVFFWVLLCFSWFLLSNIQRAPLFPKRVCGRDHVILSIW